MAFDLKPGDICVVSKNYFVDGKPALLVNDEVEIKDIKPHRERPGYKYIVYSERLGTHIRLRGYDLQRITCPDCHDILSPPYLTCTSCGWKSLLKDSEDRRERMENFYRLQRQRHSRRWGF